jgi:hypothetical protein
MACTTCNPVPLAEPPPAPAGPFVERTTTVTSVVGVNGQAYALNQPLIPPGHFPRNNCSAVVRIKGIDRTIDKPTCIEVFNEAMRIYQLNNEEFWFVNLWLNLNLQWIPRVSFKYQLVTVAQLEAISTPASP